ncbi:aminotransferase class I/II-fold pyridoxal phosphate-dependent enzyme [Planctomycetota bacterium]
MSENQLRQASLLLHAAPESRSLREGAGLPSGAEASSVPPLLEHRLALLHGTAGAVATSGRLGALALLASHLMMPGDNMVCADQLSGETYAFLDVTCARFGYDIRFVSSPWEADLWEQRVDERTQLLFAECPSDPNMFVPDLEALSALARDHCIPLVVDTTVATPVCCRATDWGADVIVCALSGDLTGHSLSSGGAVMGSEELITALREAAKRSAACSLSPQAASMVLLGMETLCDRLRTKRDNVMAVRSFLLERRAEGEVTFVNHPSLKKHPQHLLARRYMKTFAGALVSFGVRGGAAAAAEFMSALRMISPSAKPGSSRTTIGHPYSTTHAGLSAEQRREAVIQENVLRLCVGNEDSADIVDDLERGFAAT